MLSDSCTRQNGNMNFDPVENLLSEEVKNNRTPSVQYVLFNKDTILKRLCFGFSDIKNKKVVDETTSYKLYSITKTFTALAILQLAEQNKLNLDQPARIYLPEMPYKTDITIRQLLTHSSGVPNPMPLSWIHAESEHQSFDRDQFFKKIFAIKDKTKSQPNEKYAYSNLGYILLGQIIEKITGASYEMYVSDNIIRRIDLNATEMGFELSDVKLLAKGYHKTVSFSSLLLGFLFDKSKFMGKTEGKWKPFKDFYVNGVSYGGLTGTPDALIKYIRELMILNNRLLAENARVMLFTENITNDKKKTGMCLSWFTGQLDGNKYFTHAGGGGGYYCEMRIYPDQGIGSVVFFNRTGFSDERYLDKVDKYYFESQRNRDGR
jgi:D-alanyl-D-alanine carboxypeptidase